MMKPRFKKASVALTLVASLLFNGLSFTCIQSVEAAKTSAIETEYDPFAEEEEVKVQKEQNNEKLTFKERLALSQKEKSPNTITIDNVLCCCQRFQSHWSSCMKFLCTNSYFCSKTKFKSIRKTSRCIYINGCCINFI